MKGISYPVQAYEISSQLAGNTRTLQCDHCQIQLQMDALTDKERKEVKEFLSGVMEKL